MSSTELFLALLSVIIGLVVLFGVVYAAIRLALKHQKQVTIEPVLEPPAQEEAMEEPPRQRSADVENPPIKHAFDFADDAVTMILEMPVSLLEDDEALAAGWVDVVSWARVTYRDILEGRLQEAAEEIEGVSPNESELTSEELEASLRRLHDSAERRRELRMLLAEKQKSS